MLSDRDVARWRLSSQRLVTPHASSAEQVVRGLLAVQAENPGQAAWAVASRTQIPAADDLGTLIDNGEVIRTHVLRPTWHFVAADDLGWLLELTAPRIRPVYHRQLEAFGVGAPRLDAAFSIVLETVAQQPDRTRDELADALARRGHDLDGPGLSVVLALLELDRLLCSGRRRGALHTYARYDDRVPPGRRVDREEALAEVALRYFTGHGPATERDLAYWATLPLADVRKGLAHVRHRLMSFEHDGRTFWHAPGDPPDPDRLRPGGHLLQMLDEIYRGYQDSRMLLDSDGLVPAGRTGLGMALVDAQIVAHVKRTVGRRVVFEVAPYGPTLGAREQAVLEEAAARYGQFLSLEHELRLRPR